MTPEIISMLVKLFRGAAWKLLPKSITKTIDPDSIAGDTICILFIVLLVVLVGYFVMPIGDQYARDQQ